MRYFYRPMLAETVDKPFDSEGWLFEVKWDGIRALSYVEKDLSIRSRNGKELINDFPELKELKKLAHNVVLDGEIVAISAGKADFQAVMTRRRALPEATVSYVLFDILEKNGKPLIDLPLLERKKILSESVKEGKRIVLSIFVENRGKEYYEAALEKGVEGIMAKKKSSKYKPGIRSNDWLKIKKLNSCDCVVSGYTRGTGRRQVTFGALILSLYDEDTLVFVGKVGTGFSDKTLKDLMEVFKPLVTEKKTLKNADTSESIVWLEPELVCEVVYQSVTNDKKLRMPRFLRIRTDKRAQECTTDQIDPGKLRKYKLRRHFAITPEPLGEDEKKKPRNDAIFVVQEHHARRLHYDLRLEFAGVLRSWAVPKGIPLKPGDRRLAVETENHPLEYAEFTGTIPEGEYGAGEVKIWDRGSYKSEVREENKIEFSLKGKRLMGHYVLVRLRKAGQKNWLLLKTKEKT